MRTRIIPAADVLAAHEQAALEIGELRRKGIHCHLEEHPGRNGPHIDVVRDSWLESPERRLPAKKSGDVIPLVGRREDGRNQRK